MAMMVTLQVLLKIPVFFLMNIRIKNAFLKVSCVSGICGEGFRYFGTGVPDGCELKCGCWGWELSLAPLQG